MAPPTDTIPNVTPQSSGLSKPLLALAYLGNVDELDPRAPRLIWLQDFDRCTIERPRPLWSIPEGRRDEILLEPRRDPRVLVRCQRASAHHATFTRHGDHWSICDEGTTNGTFVFCLPGSTGACKTGWDDIIAPQLDYRNRPCNMVELMPRLLEK